MEVFALRQYLTEPHRGFVCSVANVMVHDLREAIANGRLGLRHQPKSQVQIGGGRAPHHPPIDPLDTDVLLLQTPPNCFTHHRLSRPKSYAFRIWFHQDARDHPRCFSGSIDCSDNSHPSELSCIVKESRKRSRGARRPRTLVSERRNALE